MRIRTSATVTQRCNGVSMSAAERSVARYEKSLSEAIAYGQSLQADYKADHRPEVKGIFKKTFGILAWVDPLEAGGSAAEVVGIEARIALANELNQAILSKLFFSSSVDAMLRAQQSPKDGLPILRWRHCIATQPSVSSS
ncbi:hypothetical protein ARMGADRAFT_427191 [Armillaria gallica]|uniref:CRA domain-containing protein n=1 Tax=Armillaria gallica TaxID=47427 RepID=A0A2H3E5N5_ARMGA|nr:hypothetical protein ARMGADRAFT_427191 [Armillaria gallica]